MHIRKNSLNFFRYKPRKWQKTCTFDIFLSPKHAFFHTFSFFLPFSMTLPPDNKKLKNSLICLVMCSLLCIFAFEHWHMLQWKRRCDIEGKTITALADYSVHHET